MSANLPNGSFFRWLLDNLPALGAALAAAGSILMAYRHRTLWVWIYAISTFFVTLFSWNNSSQTDKGHGSSQVHSHSEGGQDSQR